VFRFFFESDGCLFLLRRTSFMGFLSPPSQPGERFPHASLASRGIGLCGEADSFFFLFSGADTPLSTPYWRLLFCPMEITFSVPRAYSLFFSFPGCSFCARLPLANLSRFSSTPMDVRFFFSSGRGLYSPSLRYGMRNPHLFSFLKPEGSSFSPLFPISD